MHGASFLSFRISPLTRPLQPSPLCPDHTPQHPATEHVRYYRFCSQGPRPACLPLGPGGILYCLCSVPPLPQAAVLKTQSFDTYGMQPDVGQWQGPTHGHCITRQFCHCVNIAAVLTQTKMATAALGNGILWDYIQTCHLPFSEMALCDT